MADKQTLAEYRLAHAPYSLGGTDIWFKEEAAWQDSLYKAAPEKKLDVWNAGRRAGHLQNSVMPART
jgi:hypothetical protein